MKIFSVLRTLFVALIRIRPVESDLPSVEKLNPAWLVSVYQAFDASLHSCMLVSIVEVHCMGVPLRVVAERFRQ